MDCFFFRANVQCATCAKCWRWCWWLWCVAETDLPLADLSAAASHVAQREISRESRHQQTDSYSYSYSSSRSASASHHVIATSRMWFRLASMTAVIHHSTLASSRWRTVLAEIGVITWRVYGWIWYDVIYTFGCTSHPEIIVKCSHSPPWPNAILWAVPEEGVAAPVPCPLRQMPPSSPPSKKMCHFKMPRSVPKVTANVSQESLADAKVSARQPCVYEGL